jgi:hypothetical protein
MNQKNVVKNAMKGGRKMEDLEEPSGGSAATAPSHEEIRSVVVRDSFCCPHTRGGIRGFGEAVFRVRQSPCLWPPPQKRHGYIFVSYIRPIGSPLVVLDARSCLCLCSDGSDARSELGDHLFEVISGGRIAG